MKKILILILVLLLIAGGALAYKMYQDQLLTSELENMMETMDNEEEVDDMDDVDEAAEAETIISGDQELDTEIQDLTNEMDGLDPNDNSPLSDL